MKKLIIASAFLFCTLFSFRVKAQDAYIGEIRMFAGNFAPQGWAKCEGQLLPIAQFQALFSLLGTTYGGNGQNNFALPDLRGRVPMGVGTGPGLPQYVLGQTGGTVNNTLTTDNLPPHQHAILAEVAAGTTASPTNAYLANTGAVDREFATTSSTTMGSTGPVGNGVPVNNMQPYTTLTFIICLQGIYPTQQ
jgi:microcystin-dependent protein